MKSLSESDKRKFYTRMFMPLRSKARNMLDVYGFDVETIHKRQDFRRKSGKEVCCYKQDFLMGSIYGADGSKVFWDRESMAGELLKRKYMGSMIFATNLEFDFNMLYYDQLEKFRLIYNNGLIGAIYAEKRNDKRRRWVFTDTLNYMRCPLAKLAEVVGEQKKEHPSTMQAMNGMSLFSRMPSTDAEKQEIADYNLNDSKITYLFAEKFRQFCTLHNMKLKLTIGSSGMDYWRRNHQKYAMKREPKDMVMQHFNGSFRGGMTQVFRRGTYDGKLWYYDYKSAYPSVMVKGTDGKGSYPDPSSYAYRQKGSTEIIENYEGICNAEVSAPYSYIPYLAFKAASGRLLFPYGTFKGWFTNFELRSAMKLGYEVTPGQSIFYHSTIKPFKEAVEYLYKLRKEYKMKKSPFEAMVKVLMNSGLFGKWGTNPNNMEELIPLKNIEFRNGQPYFENKPIENAKINESVGLFDGFVTRKRPSKPFKYSFPIWSEYTTALGRNKLMMDIRNHQENLVYCDTDSAVMMKPVFQAGSELGDWELEHVLKGGVFIRSKLYMLHKDDGSSVCRSKGVGRYMSSEDDFVKAIHTGCVGMERFTKMKESNNMRVKSGSVLMFEKHLMFDDDKRDWNGRRFRLDDWQDSAPLRLVNGLTEGDARELEIRACEFYDRKKLQKEMEGLERTDAFDSMGGDVSRAEFLENEKSLF